MHLQLLSSALADPMTCSDIHVPQCIGSLSGPSLANTDCTPPGLEPPSLRW